MTIFKCHYLGILIVTYCKYFCGVYTPFYTQDFCRFKCNSDKVMTC